ncbi:uncharacterized protein LOC129962268 [Argiope bruennichi]|uniref:uncharacterized protein LOC129962268 n=1 Tax=Argiope bruennichi TaxID=94029 RepID=UPI00249418A3|nr:uncharacterized protein LOC129962268 [Argiope bruennichi]
MDSVTRLKRHIYGAAIYARTVNLAGEVKVKLIASKSRVSPIKQVTIPRLELCSAVLLTKLMQKVKNALKMDITSVSYCSDSIIVLSWMDEKRVTRLKNICCKQSGYYSRIHRNESVASSSFLTKSS